MVDSKEVLGPLDHIQTISVDGFKNICRTCLSSEKLSNIEDTKLDGVDLHDIMRLPLLQVRTIVLITRIACLLKLYKSCCSFIQIQ